MSSLQIVIVMATSICLTLLTRSLFAKYETPQPASPPSEYGVFTPMFDDIAYLTLLHLSDDDGTREAIARLRQCCALSASPQPDIQRLFADTNWRPHLVAAAALLMSGKHAASISAAWDAIDRGSWVTPQIAAALSVIDPQFQDEATHRLENLCPTDDPARRKMTAVEAHSATGPAGLRQRSAKTAASLFRLLEHQLETAHLRDLRNYRPLQNLLAADIDNSAHLAESWLNRITALK